MLASAAQCNCFGSQVFTPAQLGLSCAVCDEPTFYGPLQTPDGTIFCCEPHLPPMYHEIDAAQVWYDSTWPGEEHIPARLAHMTLGEIATFANGHLPEGQTWVNADFEDRLDAANAAALAAVARMRTRMHVQG